MRSRGVTGGRQPAGGGVECGAADGQQRDVLTAARARWRTARPGSGAPADCAAEPGLPTAAGRVGRRRALAIRQHPAPSARVGGTWSPCRSARQPEQQFLRAGQQRPISPALANRRWWRSGGPSGGTAPRRTVEVCLRGPAPQVQRGSGSPVAATARLSCCAGRPRRPHSVRGDLDVGEHHVLAACRSPSWSSARISMPGAAGTASTDPCYRFVGVPTRK